MTSKPGMPSPVIDVELLAASIWTASERHDDHPWVDATEDQRAETLEWAGEIAGEYARLGAP